MTDTPTPDETEPDGDHLADLRAAAERGKAAQADADAARRELAFVKAGIDTDKGPGKLLFKSYQGEPTKEAVMAAAEEYGITPAVAAAPEPEKETVIGDDERQHARERASLATGAEVPGGEPSPDPRLAGLAAYQEARKAGEPADDASAAFFGKVLEAAANGDKRVLFDEREWKEQAKAYR